MVMGKIRIKTILHLKKVSSQLSSDMNDKGISSFPNSVAFLVEDNGPKIPEDKAGDIFKKFYQIDTSLTRRHRGSGLGLTICKGIVEAHGGKIWLDTNYRAGACMIFTLQVDDTQKPH